MTVEEQLAAIVALIHQAEQARLTADQSLRNDRKAFQDDRKAFQDDRKAFQDDHKALMEAHRAGEARLARIEERHEALAQSVELLTADINATQPRFAFIATTFETVLDSIKRLETIALAHEHRIDRLEG